MALGPGDDLLSDKALLMSQVGYIIDTFDVRVVDNAAAELPKQKYTCQDKTVENHLDNQLDKKGGGDPGNDSVSDIALLMSQT